MMLFAKMASARRAFRHANSPTVVAVGTQAHGTGAVSPGIPAGVAEGDLLLMLVEGSDNSQTAPTGWSAVTASAVNNNANNSYLNLHWKWAVSGESAPTVADRGDHTIARIIAFRGVGNDGPELPWLDNTVSSSLTPGSFQNGNSSSPSFVVKTAQTDNTMHVFVTWGSADVATGQMTWNTATEQMDDWTTDGDGGGFSLGTLADADAGAGPTFSITSSTSMTWATMNFYIRGKLE